LKIGWLVAGACVMRAVLMVSLLGFINVGSDGNHDFLSFW
jgi:hypothetical protein